MRFSLLVAPALLLLSGCASDPDWIVDLSCGADQVVTASENADNEITTAACVDLPAACASTSGADLLDDECQEALCGEPVATPDLATWTRNEDDEEFVVLTCP